MLKHIFTKSKLCRKEALLFETLGNFGIFPINLKPGKFHVLGDILSVEVMSLVLDEVTHSYEDH